MSSAQRPLPSVPRLGVESLSSPREVKLRNDMDTAERLEDCFHRFHSKLTRVVTVAQEYEACCQQLAAKGELLSDALIELFRGGDLESSMYRNLSGVLKLTEQLKSSWHKTFDAQFVRPLRRVLDEDLVFPDDLQQSVSSARDQYDHALFGVYEGYKKDSPRNQMHGERLDTAFGNFDSLNESYTRLLDRQTTFASLELQEQLCNYVFSQQTYMQQSFQFIRTTEPSLRQTLSKIQLERINFCASDQASPRLQASLSDSQQNQQGYLLMRHQGGPLSTQSAWKMKWFFLQNGSLCYSRRWKDPTPQHTIPLLLCTFKPVIDSERPFGFDVISPEKVVRLRALTQEDFRAWKQALESVILSQLEQKQPGDTLRPSSTLVAQLYAADPSNTLCCDCSATNPTWAVVNKGVLVCIACSGIHRSLGVQQSKVRSITLDAWNPLQIQLMIAMGNSQVNRFWEHGLNPDDKIGPQAPRSERTSFISRKWSDHEFFPKFPPEEVSKHSLACQMLEAIQHDNPLGIVQLLALGLTTDTPAPGGGSLLHYAVACKSELSALLLILAEFDVNLLDDQGRTPLHIAVKLNDIALADELIRRGADTELADNEGHIPLDLCDKSHSTELRTLLLASLPSSSSEASASSPETVHRAQRRQTVVRQTSNPAVPSGMTSSTLKKAGSTRTSNSSPSIARRSTSLRPIRTRTFSPGRKDRKPRPTSQKTLHNVSRLDLDTASISFPSSSIDDGYKAPVDEHPLPVPQKPKPPPKALPRSSSALARLIRRRNTYSLPGPIEYHVATLSEEDEPLDTGEAVLADADTLTDLPPPPSRRKPKSSGSSTSKRSKKKKTKKKKKDDA